MTYRHHIRKHTFAPALLAFALVLTACGGEDATDDGSTDGPSAPDGSAEEPAAEGAEEPAAEGAEEPAAEGAEEPAAEGTWEPEWVDGVLQPLPNGFPNEEILLIVSDTAESADGILMNDILPIVNEMSPVQISGEAREEYDTGGWGTWEALRYILDTEGGTDGYVLMVQGTPGPLVNTLTDPITEEIDVSVDDITEIITFEQKPYILIQSTCVDWEPDLEALMQWIRDNPGELRYSGGGPGSGTDLGFALMMDQMEVGNMYDPDVISHLNIGNTTERATAVAACETDITNTTYEAAAPHIQADKVEVVAVGSDERLSEFPDVPTTAEFGIENNPFVSGKQLVGGHLPDEHVLWLHELFLAAAETDEFTEARLRLPGTQLRNLGPEESEELNESSLAIVDPLLRELGIHLEQVAQ